MLNKGEIYWVKYEKKIPDTETQLSLLAVETEAYAHR